MKTVCYLLILWLPAICNAATLSCQGGWRWLDIAGIEQLKDSGDQAPTVGCNWLSDLTPGKRILLPAFPSLSYERALPTEYSRSKGYIRYEYWQLSVPLLRLGDVYTHFDYISDYRKQQHQLGDAVIWEDTALPSGTRMLLDSSERNYRLTFDLQGLNSPVSYVWLTYRQQWQPMNISINNRDVLTNVELVSKTIGLGYQPHGYGIFPRFSLSIGSGDIRNDGDTPELDHAGEQMKYQLIEAYGGIQARYRLTRQLVAHAHGGARVRYFMLPGEDEDESVGKDSFTSLDYAASTGVSWSF